VVCCWSVRDGQLTAEKAINGVKGPQRSFWCLMPLPKNKDCPYVPAGSVLPPGPWRVGDKNARPRDPPQGEGHWSSPSSSMDAWACAHTNGSMAADRKKRQNDTKYTSLKKVEKWTIHFADFPENPRFGGFINPEWLVLYHLRCLVIQCLSKQVFLYIVFNWTLILLLTGTWLFLILTLPQD